MGSALHARSAGSSSCAVPLEVTCSNLLCKGFIGTSSHKLEALQPHSICHGCTHVFFLTSFGPCFLFSRQYFAGTLSAIARNLGTGLLESMGRFAAGNASASVKTVCASVKCSFHSYFIRHSSRRYKRAARARDVPALGLRQ